MDALVVLEQSVAMVQRDPEPVVATVAEQGPRGIQGIQGIQGESAMHWEDFVVDANMIAEAWTFLQNAPVDPLKVEVVIQHGIHQRAGVDFYVTGNSLIWGGLGMELLLEEGDFFTVRYV